MEEERTRKKLLILYATQTGNALSVAERVGRETERRGCPVHLLSLDQYDARCLAQEGTVIFVVSTTGQGDTPDPMNGFWKDLLQKNLSRQWLEGLRYAVFGLVIPVTRNSILWQRSLIGDFWTLGQPRLSEEVWEMISTHQGVKLLWIRGWHHCGIC
ncbi:hypothetical protein ACFXTN_041438 [Malus domestica]